MKSHHIIDIVLIILGIAICVAGIVLGSSYNQFVTSTYSKYCYKVGNENGNMEKKFYYQTLEDCGKPYHK